MAQQLGLKYDVLLKRANSAWKNYCSMLSPGEDPYASTGEPDEAPRKSVMAEVAQASTSESASSSRAHVP